MHALCFSVGAQGFSPAKTKANSRGFRDWAFLQTLPDGLFPQPLQSHRKPLRFNEALASEGTVADSIRPALSQQKMAGATSWSQPKQQSCQRSGLPGPNRIAANCHPAASRRNCHSLRKELQPARSRLSETVGSSATRSGGLWSHNCTHRVRLHDYTTCKVWVGRLVDST